MGAWGGVGVAECWASQPHNREFRDVTHDQSGGSSSSTTPSVGLRSNDSGPNLLYGSFAAMLVAGQRSQLQCFLATAQAGLSFVSEYPAMTPDELKAHVASTHPRCEFCRESFYGLDEQYRHMNDKHYSCHICQRQGMPHVYHRVGAGLGAGMAAGRYGAYECGPCGSSAYFCHGEAPHPASCTISGAMSHSLSDTPPRHPRPPAHTNGHPDFHPHTDTRHALPHAAVCAGCSRASPSHVAQPPSVRGARVCGDGAHCLCDRRGAQAALPAAPLKVSEWVAECVIVWARLEEVLWFPTSGYQPVLHNLHSDFNSPASCSAQSAASARSNGQHFLRGHGIMFLVNHGPKLEGWVCKSPPHLDID